MQISQEDEESQAVRPACLQSRAQGILPAAHPGTSPLKTHLGRRRLAQMNLHPESASTNGNLACDYNKSKIWLCLPF